MSIKKGFVTFLFCVMPFMGNAAVDLSDLAGKIHDFSEQSLQQLAAQAQTDSFLKVEQVGSALESVCQSTQQSPVNKTLNCLLKSVKKMQKNDLVFVQIIRDTLNGLSQSKQEVQHLLNQIEQTLLNMEQTLVLGRISTLVGQIVEDSASSRQRKSIRDTKVALRKLPDSRNSEIVINFIEDLNDALVESLATEIGNFSGPSWLELVGQMRAEHPSVQRKAIRDAKVALYKLPDDGNPEIVINLIKDLDSALIESLVVDICALNDPSLLELVEKMQDGDPSGQRKALQSVRAHLCSQDMLNSGIEIVDLMKDLDMTLMMMFPEEILTFNKQLLEQLVKKQESAICRQL
ncbi:MAG: hypothetical protein LBE99_01180 [Puniceicoccales bacterium]|jgi:hypothetical protein|nr:hypothetical protein [Puniceicoccales bacterium]